MSYGEVVGTLILVLLLAWATMDRCNFYFVDKDK